MLDEENPRQLPSSLTEKEVACQEHCGLVTAILRTSLSCFIRLVRFPLLHREKVNATQSMILFVWHAFEVQRIALLSCVVPSHWSFLSRVLLVRILQFLLVSLPLNALAELEPLNMLIDSVKNTLSVFFLRLPVLPLLRKVNALLLGN